MARIIPAMGMMTVSDRLWIILKMVAFQPWGVCPIWPEIPATCWLTESNIPVRLLTIPSTRTPFSHS